MPGPLKPPKRVPAKPSPVFWEGLQKALPKRFLPAAPAKPDRVFQQAIARIRWETGSPLRNLRPPVASSAAGSAAVRPVVHATAHKMVAPQIPLAVTTRQIATRPRARVGAVGARMGAVAGALTPVGRTRRAPVPAPQPGPAPVTLQDLIDQIVGPQLAYYQGQQQQLTQRQQAQQQALSLYSQQLLAALGQVPGQIQSDYAGALSTTQALGQQGMQALQAANPNAQNQALLSAIGAPQAQHEALQQQNQDVFGGGGAVLNYTGGVLPGQTFAQDQAARTAYARSLPEVQALSGRQALVQLLAGQGKESDALAAAVAQLRSDATRQAYSIQNQLATQDYRQQQAAALQAYRNQQLRYQGQQLKLSAAKTSLAGRVAGDRSKQGWARLTLQQRSLATRELQNDRSYQMALARLGIAERGLQIRSAAAQARLNAGGFTKSQTLQLQKRAGAIASRAFNGIKTTGKDKTGAPFYSHFTYQEAMREGLAQGIPLTAMQDALNKYWTKPGAVQAWERWLPSDNPANPAWIGHVIPGGGRPMLSYQQRRAAGMEGGTPPFAADATPVEVIRTFAPRLGLDPAAVLAYALTQGGTSWGAVGDQGTSFGPFQAHLGGALGAHDEAWANSPEGLVELMQMMANAGARGRTGPEAAAFIVGPAFGRGANPARDMANARAQYTRALQLLGTV